MCPTLKQIDCEKNDGKTLPTAEIEPPSTTEFHATTQTTTSETNQQSESNVEVKEGTSTAVNTSTYHQCCSTTTSNTTNHSSHIQESSTSTGTPLITNPNNKITVTPEKQAQIKFTQKTLTDCRDYAIANSHERSVTMQKAQLEHSSTILTISTTKYSAKSTQKTIITNGSTSHSTQQNSQGVKRKQDSTNEIFDNKQDQLAIKLFQNYEDPTTVVPADKCNYNKQDQLAIQLFQNNESATAVTPAVKCTYSTSKDHPYGLDSKKNPITRAQYNRMMENRTRAKIKMVRQQCNHVKFP